MNILPVCCLNLQKSQEFLNFGMCNFKLVTVFLQYQKVLVQVEVDAYIERKFWYIWYLQLGAKKIEMF